MHGMQPPWRPGPRTCVILLGAVREADTDVLPSVSQSSTQQYSRL